LSILTFYLGPQRSPTTTTTTTRFFIFSAEEFYELVAGGANHYYYAFVIDHHQGDFEKIMSFVRVNGNMLNDFRKQNVVVIGRIVHYNNNDNIQVRKK